MASNGPISHRTVIEGRTPAITQVCKQILCRLKANDFSQEDIFAVHLALEEAFINAIKHGNKMNPKKEIKVDYSVSLDKIEICMTDEGKGFDPGAVPDPRYGDHLLKPGGRGLFLMRAYMDVVEFNDRGNRVRMVRYRNRRPATPNQSQRQQI
jgi:serine/threonine-protein kinase RsbW